MTTDSRETAPVGWEVSEVRTVDGEAMVVGGNGAEFGLIATVTDIGDARLIAAAPDHALVIRAMCIGAARWEPFGDGTGEFCMNGLRHSTRLDEFGAPVVTPTILAAISKALGASHG